MSSSLKRHCLGVSETEELLVEANLIEAGACCLLVVLLLSHLLGGQDLVAAGVIGQATRLLTDQLHKAARGRVYRCIVVDRWRGLRCHFSGDRTKLKSVF